jgi:dTDP-glucose 4,6-dehydratase
MSILVTGGCGFIASNFINVMKRRYPSRIFVNIDKLDYCSNLENVDEGVCVFLQGNICDMNFIEYVVKKYNFNTVFHFAAQSHVDNSFLNPTSFTIDNTYGTHVLLELCRKNIPNVEFIHFSTDEVYGQSTTDTPYTEECILNPTNPYSGSKAAAEMIIRSYIKSFDMNIKVIRCNNVYGQNQYPEKLIPKFKRLLKENKKCTIHGSRAGKVKRGFIHVDDVIDAVEVVWTQGKSGEIYNIASEYELSIEEITHLLIKHLKGTTDYGKWITYIDDRPFNDQRYLICANKLKKLGWCQKKSKDDLVNFLSE